MANRQFSKNNENPKLNVIWNIIFFLIPSLFLPASLSAHFLSLAEQKAQTHILSSARSLSLADTSINHFQFDTRQKRLHVYYVFMHMIAQIIIMMMVANVACIRHELVSKFLILFIVQCSQCVYVWPKMHGTPHFPLSLSLSQTDANTLYD